MIYSFVLDYGVVYISPNGVDTMFKCVPSISLLRVCRQVYTETCLLPYKLNTFEFRSFEWPCRFEYRLKKFLAMRSKAQLALLSRIQIRIHGTRVRTAAVWEEILRGPECFSLAQLDWYDEDDGSPWLFKCIHEEGH